MSKQLKRYGSTAASLLLALGARAIGRWPLLAAAVGGVVVHRLWSTQRQRKLTLSSSGARAKPKKNNATTTIDESAAVLEGWSPTTPGVQLD